MSQLIDSAEWISDPDIKKLLIGLESDRIIQICSPLGGSRKNPIHGTVFKVCYLDDSQRPWSDGVIKIGLTKSLKEEFKNYSEYVQKGPLPTEYKVDLYEPKYINDKAILQIDFVNIENYKVLADYYKEEDTTDVLKILLNKVLKHFHDKTCAKYYDIDQYISSRLLTHRDNIIEECKRLFPNIENTCQCLVQQLKRVLTNPVFFLYQKEKFLLKKNNSFWTIESIIHGDLNFNNIFIQNTDNIKLIDYEKTGKDIVFDDLARLECEIKFIFLKNYNIPMFWQGLLEFEEFLMRQLVIDEDKLPDSAKEYEDIRKAVKCIAIIRKRADEIIKQNARVKDSAYWIELLLRTLKYVGYKSQDGVGKMTDSQKKYALISSILLADNYLGECHKPLDMIPLVISPGPQLKEDSVLSGITYKSEIGEKIEKERMSDLKRALIAGQVVLFLGPNAPKSSNAPTKLELAKILYKKYNGEPTIKKSDLLFNILLKSKDTEQSVLEDMYTTYQSASLQGLYQVIPSIQWKRIYVEYIDFLVERSYEELKDINKLQSYENRFYPGDSRNDEDKNIVVIERPCGSARFYNDPDKMMCISAENMARSKSARMRWYDLINDMRSPITILFYGFDWENLKELYFDIAEHTKVVNENTDFFWVSEEFKDDDVIEVNSTGMITICCKLEHILREIASIKKEKYNNEHEEKGITISLKDKNIYLDKKTFENYSAYFEILHDEIDKMSGFEIGPFFKGEQINWGELAANCDVPRDRIKKSSLEQKIIDEIKNVDNKVFLLLADYAGSGTTTIMKRIGFNISKKRICPIIYLRKLDHNTWKILQEFYQYCDKKKFLILIDNIPSQFEKFKELYGILQSRRISNVILATARKDEYNQIMISYIQGSGEDINENSQSRFKWIYIQPIDDILTREEKTQLIQKFKNFGILTKPAASKFGLYSTNELRYSNLLPLCWAATEGKNRKFETIVKEYYNKLNLSEQKIVNIVCTVNLFYSEGITDRILHRVIKVSWDRFKLLLNSDLIQQLIMTSEDYYGERHVYRIIPRNYGIAEILLQPETFEFPQKVLQTFIDNLSIKEGEQVEEDLLFNIVRNKTLHGYIKDKSDKNKLFEFAHNQLPYDNRILQHWGIILYEYARDQSKIGNLEDPAWEESIEKLNQALANEPSNPAIYHSLGMAIFVRGGLYWDRYRHNRLDKSSYDLANIYFQEAIKHFQESLSLNPRDEHAYNTIAKIKLGKVEDLIYTKNTKNIENSMAEIHELLEECSNNVPIHKQLILETTRARWYDLRGDKSEAEKRYRKILEKEPKNHSTSYLLAALLTEKSTIKSLRDAEIVLNKAIGEGLRTKGFYRLRYRISEKLYPFEYGKLEILLKGLIEMYPNDPYLVFKYAVICFKNKNYELSNQYFKISDNIRFGDPRRLEFHDFFWKETKEQDEIKQIWEGKNDQMLLKEFGGNIETISNRKGFIVMDISGIKLYFDPMRCTKYETFQKGQRVRYNIAFNYIQPQAIIFDAV